MDVASQVINPGFGRLVAPDSRDTAYPARRWLDAFGSDQLPASRYYRTGPVLNQGHSSMCVGYAWRQFLASAPVMYAAADPAAPTIYAEAQTLDEWPGEGYEGTSVRAGAKALQARSLLVEYRWATAVDDIVAWLLGGHGTVVMGTNWYTGMMQAKPGRNAVNVLHATGPLEGGHAYLLVGASAARRQVRVLNSWGAEWGDKGHAWLPYDDLARLLSEAGEACCAVER